MCPAFFVTTETVYVFKVQGFFICHIKNYIIRSEMEVKSGPLSGQCKRIQIKII